MKEPTSYSYAVLSDFDGTITDRDSLQYVFNRYASDEWLHIEALWKQGELSTINCLKSQLALVNPIHLPEIIDDLIQSVCITPGFPEFLCDMENSGIYFGILSDGLDCFINSILRHNSLADRGQVYANHLEAKPDQLEIHFPYVNAAHPQCANCKGGVIESLRKECNFNKVIFIGDGLSDRCAARYADILFAKDGLANYCLDEGIPFIPFVNYHDVRQKITNLIQNQLAY